MSFDQQCLILGLLSGGAAGALAFLYVLFDGFKEFPKRLPSNASSQKRYRLLFLIFRIVFGAVVGFFVTFWFLDDVRTGKLSLGKLVFIQFASGGCASFLQLAAQQIKRLFV